MTSGTMVIAAPRDLLRPRVTLRVVRADGGAEAAVVMRGETLICGRQGDLAFPDDPFIASAQARFFFTAAQLAVEDLGGGNGVFLRLRQPREVPVGGEIRLGRQRLRVEPLPAPTSGPAGEVAWGSPDLGYRIRLIQLLEGGGKGSAFPLRDGENQLGRESGDVTFPHDGFVSGRHARLSVHGDHLVVEDVGSSNGTFIRLSAPAYVTHGDQLLIGRQLIRLEVVGGPVTSARPQP